MQQVPWILNDTIRANILLGQPLDEDRYNHVIDICQLGRDLEILEGGDLTQIGEKGINLSGGQKARISIARAVYSQKDIVLMDDPFSALDAHVKKNIFEEVCLQELKHKTRIIVTHAIDFLDRVDRIIVMDKGSIIHQGHFNDLKDLEYFKIIIKHMAIGDENEREEVKDNSSINESIALRSTLQKQKTKRTDSFVSSKASFINKNENSEELKLNWRIYSKFFSYTKWTTITTISLFLMFAIRRIFNILFNYIMLRWVKSVSQGDENHNELLSQLVIVVSIYTLCSILSGVIHILFTLSINIKLFKDMLKRLFRAPVNKYFDVTPSGVILNRFSKDLQMTEMSLTYIVRGQMITYLNIISSIALAIYNVVWVSLLIPIVFFSLFYFMRVFKKAYKEISRVESISSSPLLTHLGETTLGSSTIRTYNIVDEFENKQYELQNKNAATVIIKRSVSGWFSCQTNFVMVGFQAFGFIYCILAKSHIDPVLAGLMLIYLIELQNEIVTAFK